MGKGEGIGGLDVRGAREPVRLSYPVAPDPIAELPSSAFSDPAKAARHEARLRRIRRWRRPLTRRRDRLRAWINMLFVDHGIFRAVYPNMHRITARAWRAAQPLPHQIRRFARAGGVAVVSLRGGQMFGSLPLEIETCAAEGLAFHTIVLRSRGLPERDELLAILDALDGLATPVLFHCKSGADRAGFMAGLWLIAMEGGRAADALDQLSIRYGHFKGAKTGVLDAFFEAYAAEGEARGLAFRDWVATAYDPAAIQAGFRPRRLGVAIADRLLGRE
ncbi:MAG: tyrosine-protein phosphatase [Paracoccaceae bacterium]